MIPVLYDAGERDFTSNGLGRLYDAISCTVTEERNGSFELEMTYPVSGIHYKDILKERIIFAVPADGKKEQPFRIYKISKPMKGITTISARHVSYQLSFVPVKADLTPATTAAQAFERLGRYDGWKLHDTASGIASVKTWRCGRLHPRQLWRRI